MTEYETIEVTDSVVYDLFDDFDGTLENVLFDQTADGARVRLHAMGEGDWTIRNVAFKGQVDTSAYSDSAQIKPAAYGGEGLIENVYLGDGAEEGTEANGILVEDEHSGVLTFRNVYVGGFTDNGLYGSDCGYDSSSALDPGHGEVHIESCYGKNNNITQFRIGSDGSYVRDSVAVVTDMNSVPVHANGGHNARGVRLHHTDANRVENCDIKSHGGHAVQAKDGGGGTLENCRITGSVSDAEGPINGESVGEPNLEPPAGVPLLAEVAASGESGDSGNDAPSIPKQPDDGGSGGDDTPAGTAFEIIAPESGTKLEYEFVADGPVHKHQTADRVFAGKNDEIVENDDGTVTVTGYTGNGYGDAYLVEGDIVEYSANDVATEFTWDGSDTTLDELLPGDGGDDGEKDPDPRDSRTLAVRSDGQNGSPFDVHFLIGGEVVSGDTSETSGGMKLSRIDDAQVEVTATDLGPGDRVAIEYTGDVLGFGAPDGVTVQYTADVDENPLPAELGDHQSNIGLTDTQRAEVEAMVADGDDDGSDGTGEARVRDIVKEELRKAFSSVTGYGN